MRICLVTSVPFFLVHHLKCLIGAATEAGHEVCLVSSPGQDVDELERMPGVSFHAIRIKRNISLLADVRTLAALYRYFRKGKFDLVHSTTPKAGFLCALAGWVVGVPIRLHTFTGQRWVELKGPVRWVAKASDWLISHLNTQCYADSKSQRNFIVSHGVATPAQIAVIGSGSLAGVDFSKFDLAVTDELRDKLRDEMSISPSGHVICFIGRITKDKGRVELVAAFNRLRATWAQLYLILVGPFEQELDPVPEVVLEQIRSCENILAVGHSLTPEKYLAVSDLLCLPSYREGFGNVVIEAAAMGIPTVGTRIVGLVDSVVDGETGLLVPPRDVDALTAGLEKVLRDGKLRLTMGAAAKERAMKLFDAESVTANILKEYNRLSDISLASGDDSAGP